MRFVLASLVLSLSSFALAAGTYLSCGNADATVHITVKGSRATLRIADNKDRNLKQASNIGLKQGSAAVFVADDGGETVKFESIKRLRESTSQITGGPTTFFLADATGLGPSTTPVLLLCESTLRP